MAVLSLRDIFLWSVIGNFVFACRVGRKSKKGHKVLGGGGESGLTNNPGTAFCCCWLRTLGLFFSFEANEERDSHSLVCFFFSFLFSHCHKRWERCEKVGKKTKAARNQTGQGWLHNVLYCASPAGREGGAADSVSALQDGSQPLTHVTVPMPQHPCSMCPVPLQCSRQVQCSPTGLTGKAGTYLLACTVVSSSEYQHLDGEEGGV